MAAPTSSPSASRTPESPLQTFLWSCIRLGRFHTLMGYAIFIVPTLLTVVLYHALNADKYENPVGRAASIAARLFICILSYRAAGCCWDDIVDRDLDKRVARTKGRPLPSGAISVTGALAYCVLQSAITQGLFLQLLPAEAALLNTIGAVLFFVYPYLKFFTHWAQLECAALIAAVAPVAWAACAAFDNSAGTQDFGALWTSSLNIVQADWRPILAIFAFECAFSFFHEIVYGCQDTAEDMKLGVYSISILLGYEGSKKALLPLTLLYLGALAYALRICGLHWMPITAVPAVVLIREALSVRMEDPKSCGIYTRNGTYVKLGVFVASAVDFAVSHA